jgi:hypothetical protein
MGGPTKTLFITPKSRKIEMSPKVSCSEENVIGKRILVWYGRASFSFTAHVRWGNQSQELRFNPRTGVKIFIGAQSGVPADFNVMFDGQLISRDIPISNIGIGRNETTDVLTYCGFVIPPNTHTLAIPPGISDLLSLVWAIRKRNESILPHDFTASNFFVDGKEVVIPSSLYDEPSANKLFMLDSKSQPHQICGIKRSFVIEPVRTH